MRAMVDSRSFSVSGSAATQARASLTDMAATSAMCRSPMVTPSASGLSRRPPQVGQGRSTMYFSSSVRMYSDSVSR